MFIICVCNDPATTEIYTDLHTLSLPDARPSFGLRHRLGLVVGDIDGGVAELVVQPADLEPHLLAEIGGQVRERLVEEKDLRLDDQGAGERHALLPAAGRPEGRRVGKAGVSTVRTGWVPCH